MSEQTCKASDCEHEWSRSYCIHCDIACKCTEVDSKTLDAKGVCTICGFDCDAYDTREALREAEIELASFVASGAGPRTSRALKLVQEALVTVGKRIA